MEVELRQTIALGDNLRRAGKIGHKLAERLFNFQDDACAACRDHRHVTAELDGIAKALLAVEQDRLAGDIVRSAPERPRKSALPEFCDRSLAAPLIFDPSILEVAGDEARQALEKMRVGIVRPQRDRLIVTRQRLIEPLQVIQRNAAIGKRLGVIGPRGERQIVARQRFLEPPAFAQGGLAWLRDNLGFRIRLCHIGRGHAG